MVRVTKNNIFAEAYEGNLDALKSKWVDKIQNDNGWTPLHYLAWKGCIKVLDHPSVAKVKEDSGKTPLHSLAMKINLELKDIIKILNHPSVDKVKDASGLTPLHFLIMTHSKKLKLKDLKVRYPWFPFKKGVKVTEELIDEILNTSNAEQFILKL